jgi:5'-nucleotidase
VIGPSTFSSNSKQTVQILLTNDDGIYAPGIQALEKALLSLGDVEVVAPATEQSGVGHSITYRKPLVTHEVFDGKRRRGWAVEGSPADSVKLGICEICPKRPDLVVSGINSGLNAGINVLYSGTVAAAIEGAFFDVLSIAVSLEFDDHADYDAAAVLARKVVDEILAHKPPPARLFNLNIPLAALANPKGVKVRPMGVLRYGEQFEKRLDPKGHPYYWAANEPPAPPQVSESDLAALNEGYLSLTPLHFDLTLRQAMAEMHDWRFDLSKG